MKILSIEPTPSPNTMKLNMDESLPKGEQRTYTKEHQASAPAYIEKLFAISGVRSVFQVVDFIAIERNASAEWQTILAGAREIFGEASEAVGVTDARGVGTTEPSAPAYGEVQVYVQMFRGIPLQVKVISGVEQQRAGLPERFGKAAMQAGASSPNLVMERTWEERGVRYGSMQEVGEELARELDAAYDDERLADLMKQAFEQGGGEAVVLEARYIQVTTEMLDGPDWRKRYAALERMNPTMEDLPVLIKALQDENASIRRLATVYLGMVGGSGVLVHLYQALQDSSVAVRRTAGDALSDIGDAAAIPVMVQALRDRNKLVRWRAARFLYEVGDESALEALQAAQNDPEFEVSMQVKMAVERIESGEEASGTVWQQMTNRNK